MKYRIHVHQAVDAGELERSVRRAALETLKTEDVESGSLTIVLTDNTTIQHLNKEFADKDAPTDVLAFPGSEPDPDEDGIYYGDIVIALPIAQQQATKAGHSILAECSLLVVHGSLHLLGYDHAAPQEKIAMWSQQARILKRLGLPSIEPAA